MSKVSSFWQYFKDYLAFPFIFTPNAIGVLIKGMSLSLDKAKADITAMRNQFIVPCADDSLMSDYGTSRNIPRTRFDEDSQYRTRTECAALWHQLGGRNTGLPQILEAYGYPGSVIENCRDTDEEKWAHFNVNLIEPGTSLEQDKIDAVLEIANLYKPARSVVNTLSFALKQECPIHAGASQRTAITFSHVVHYGELSFDSVGFYVGTGQSSFITVINTVKNN